MTASVAWVNGSLTSSSEAAIAVTDRGFALGDGVFETMLAPGGRPFRFDAHLARLRSSAGVLRLPVPLDDTELATAIGQTTSANSLVDAVVRLTVTRGVTDARGLVPPLRPRCTVVVQAYPAPAHSQAGLRVAIASARRNEQSPVSRIKATGGYLDNLVARLEAKEHGFDDAILLNTIGQVACASVANVHLVTREGVLTPAPECGALVGITSGAVGELAALRGIRWGSGTLMPADLLAADEVFLTNSVQGVVPVLCVGGNVIGRGEPGPITHALRADYDALLTR